MQIDEVVSRREWGVELRVMHSKLRWHIITGGAADQSVDTLGSGSLMFI